MSVANVTVNFPNKNRLILAAQSNERKYNDLILLIKEKKVRVKNDSIVFLFNDIKSYNKVHRAYMFLEKPEIEYFFNSGKFYLNQYWPHADFISNNKLCFGYSGNTEIRALAQSSYVNLYYTLEHYLSIINAYNCYFGVLKDCNSRESGVCHLCESFFQVNNTHSLDFICSECLSISNVKNVKNKSSIRRCTYCGSYNYRFMKKCKKCNYVLRK